MNKYKIDMVTLEIQQTIRKKLKVLSLYNKKVKIILNNFSDHNGIKLDISYKKKIGKFTNMWKLKSCY